MIKKRLSKQSFGTMPLWVVWISVLMVTTAQVTSARSDSSNEPDKQQVTRQLAQDWMQIGTRQYERGFYKQAEQSLQFALDYQEGLTQSERKQVKELLGKIQSGATERTYIQENLRAADELVNQGELLKAKTILKEIQDKQFLTKQEHDLIAKSLKNIDSQLNRQEKEIAELYNASLEFYHKGQLEKAREGFAKIDSILAKKAELSKSADAMQTQVVPQTLQTPAEVTAVEQNSTTIKNKSDNEASAEKTNNKAIENEATEAAEANKVKSIQEPNKASLFEIAEPKTIEGPAVDENSMNEKSTDDKENIMRSYTKAVVSDALVKSQNYIDQGNFEQAKETVEAAEQIVNKNHLYLGNDLFGQYSTKLKQMAEKIVQEKNRRSK